MKKILTLFSIVIFLSCSKVEESIQSYVNELEFKITGSSKDVVIVRSVGDTLKNVVLPYSIQFKTLNNSFTNIEIFNNTSIGSISVQIFFKDKSIGIETQDLPRGSMKLFFDKTAGTYAATKKAPNEWTCGIYNGKQLYTGPEGGCYYVNSNNNKTYVDRSNCSCK